MRALVAVATSGSSRSALETVMIDTPARCAMSFSRSIGQAAGDRRWKTDSQRRSPPMKFSPQGVAKGTTGQVHHPHRAPASSNGDLVASEHFADHLPVATED